MEMRAMLAALCCAAYLSAQPAGANYDDSKVPNYTLPDPLKLVDGTPVRDAKTWNTKRRPELVRLFEENVYGRAPQPRGAGQSYGAPSIDRGALNGAAVRKQVTVQFAKSGPEMHILMY